MHSIHIAHKTKYVELSADGATLRPAPRSKLTSPRWGTANSTAILHNRPLPYGHTRAAYACTASDTIVPELRTLDPFLLSLCRTLSSVDNGTESLCAGAGAIHTIVAVPVLPLRSCWFRNIKIRMEWILCAPMVGADDYARKAFAIRTKRSSGHGNRNEIHFA